MLYLSPFDEQMTVFPPLGYAFAWYARIAGSIGKPIWNSPRIALAERPSRSYILAGMMLILGSNRPRRSQ